MSKKISELQSFKIEDGIQGMVVQQNGSFKNMDIKSHLFEDEFKAIEEVKIILNRGHKVFIIGFIE